MNAPVVCNPGVRQDSQWRVDSIGSIMPMLAGNRSYYNHDEPNAQGWHISAADTRQKE